MRKIFIYFIIVLFSASSATTVIAGDINKGIKSISGSSRFQFSNQEFDHEGMDTKNYDFFLDAGYFISKNLEIALGIEYQRVEGEHDYVTNRYTVIPTISYYIPITEKTNFFTGIGIGLGKYEIEPYNNGAEIFEMGAKAGFNFFIARNVALIAEASYWRVEWNNDPGSDLSENRITIPQIGIKLFF